MARRATCAIHEALETLRGNVGWKRRPRKRREEVGGGGTHKSRRRLLDGRPRTDWVEARSFGYSSLSWLTRAATPTHLHEVALRSGVLACRNCATRPASALCSRRCRLFFRVYSLRCVYRSTLCFRDTASPQRIARYAAAKTSFRLRTQRNVRIFAESSSRVSCWRVFSFFFPFAFNQLRLLRLSCNFINRLRIFVES